MHKMWLVARREYLFNLRRRSFLLSAFGIPVFVVVIMLIVFNLAFDEGNVETFGDVGYVDRTGILSEAVDRPETFFPYADEETAQTALNDGALNAYFLVPDAYMLTGVVELYTTVSLPELVEDAVSEYLQANLAAGIESSLPVERIRDPVEMTVYIQDSGRELTEESLPALFSLPLIFALVFMMSLQVTSGFLMSGVVEEKTNRIMEILITSVTPMEMLTGKVIGLGLLGLTQMAIWVLVGALTLGLGQDIAFLSGIEFPTDLVVVSLIYFVLYYFLMGSVMAGIGAVVGGEQEGRQYAGILTIFLVIPFFALVQFISEPNGSLALILSFIPFTAPISMILRISLGAVPFWQIIVSLVLLTIAMMFVIWLSARVFRWGLLMYGKRVSVREILRIIRQAPGMGTVATAQQEVTT